MSMKHPATACNLVPGQSIKVMARNGAEQPVSIILSSMVQLQPPLCQLLVLTQDCQGSSAPGCAAHLFMLASFENEKDVFLKRKRTGPPWPGTRLPYPGAALLCLNAASPPSPPQHAAG